MWHRQGWGAWREVQSLAVWKEADDRASSDFHGPAPAPPTTFPRVVHAQLKAEAPKT